MQGRLKDIPPFMKYFNDLVAGEKDGSWMVFVTE
jgi:hypothetical protein